MNCCAINYSYFLVWTVYFLFLKYFWISSWTCTCCLTWLVLAQYQVCHKYDSLTDKCILHQQHCLSHVNNSQGFLYHISSLWLSRHGSYQQVPEDMWKWIYYKLLIHLTFSGIIFSHSSLFSVICKIAESLSRSLIKIIQIFIHVDEISFLQVFSSLCWTAPTPSAFP